MTPQERLHKIAGFVTDHLEEMARRYPSPGHDPIYRWAHTLRVTRYGQQIAQAEGADVEIVVTACLLHDVAHFDPMDDYKDHGREGARLSRPFLEELDYLPAEIENICYAIAAHVDDKADFEHPHTLEANIVSDADNIDRFGAFRILQWCVPDMGDFPALADKLRQRVVQLERYLQSNPLATETGRVLFAQQLERQIAFFNDLVAEFELTRLPEL
jgi:hypothetical protein